ncbi:MAG TPA: hypothetical protein DCE41_05380 [Cytophagales bacterium]|nr:hypothetical protein [Cytophagales bacterium]
MQGIPMQGNRYVGIGSKSYTNKKGAETAPFLLLTKNHFHYENLKCLYWVFESCLWVDLQSYIRGDILFGFSFF